MILGLGFHFVMILISEVLVTAFDVHQVNPKGRLSKWNTEKESRRNISTIDAYIMVDGVVI